MGGHIPAATGFALVAAPSGTPAGSPREVRFATAGTATPVSFTAGGWRWSGSLLGLGDGDGGLLPPGRSPAPSGAGAPGRGGTTGFDAFAGDGRAGVLIAGELYNRRELARAVGEAGLEDAGDAQVLLACFRRYGPHAFRLLNGRFAALAGDGDVLVAATDHCGGVPLYLTAGEGRTVLATEAKVLLARGGVPAGRPVPGLRRVRGGIGVYQVPAGSALVVERTAGVPRTRVLRTWAPPLHRRHLPEEEAVREVRTALERAVRARLPEGSEPTAVLSGGIDSSAVAALAAAAGGGLHTVSMGTELRDEFPEARLVADHLARPREGRGPGRPRHTEIRIGTAELLAELPWTVWAAETTDPDITEYLLPLAALYRRLPADRPLRILTGYGADIPLGGMHREADRLVALDDAVAHDMDTFDGLNEMSPVLSGAAGHWTTHPYWDRDLLELLVTLEAGLKRRHGRDKWVLREALADLLPAQTVRRPKLGVHEGSGTTSAFTVLLRDLGVPRERIADAKGAVVRRLYDAVVGRGVHPDEVDLTHETKAVLYGTATKGDATHP